jgi:hypothetical protein
MNQAGPFSCRAMLYLPMVKLPEEIPFLPNGEKDIMRIVPKINE